MLIETLTNIFLLLFIINFFITFYSIYTFFEVFVFQNMQGYKLIKKKKDIISKWLILKKFVFQLFLLYVLF